MIFLELLALPVGFLLIGGLFLLSLYLEAWLHTLPRLILPFVTATVLQICCNEDGLGRSKNRHGTVTDMLKPPPIASTRKQQATTAKQGKLLRL